MKVILLADVKSLGKKDDIVEVKEGYARNFLFTKNLGVPADNKNLSDVKARKKAEANQAAARLAEAEELKTKIESVTCVCRIKAGKDGKAFGSVSTKEIAEETEKQHGILLDKKKLEHTGEKHRCADRKSREKHRIYHLKPGKQDHRKSLQNIDFKQMFPHPGKRAIPDPQFRRKDHDDQAEKAGGEKGEQAADFVAYKKRSERRREPSEPFGGAFELLGKGFLTGGNHHSQGVAERSVVPPRFLPCRVHEIDIRDTEKRNDRNREPGGGFPLYGKAQPGHAVKGKDRKDVPV